MTKLIGEPVTTYAENDSILTAFIWRKRLYRVSEVLNWWREPSDWWDDKSIRYFVLVNARNSSEGTYELYRIGESWFLQRVLD